MHRLIIAVVGIIVLAGLGAAAYVALRPAPTVAPAADTAKASSTPTPTVSPTTTPERPTTTTPAVEHPATNTAPRPAPPAPTATTSGFKTYRNKEWGFAFEYPEGWNPKERAFKNYYSKFNIVLHPVDGKYYALPVYVNIVPPEFSENTFKNLDKTTEEVVVGGIAGEKYTYEWQGERITSIVLPFGQYNIILGADPHYLELFEQVLKSFRFLH